MATSCPSWTPGPRTAADRAAWVRRPTRLPLVQPRGDGVGHADRWFWLASEGEPGLVGRGAGGVGRVEAVGVDDHDLARLEFAEKDLLRQLVLDLALDGAAQRPRPQHRVETTPGQQRARVRRQ